MGALLPSLTGKTFGRWTVIKRGGYSKDKRILWECRCNCGTEKLVVGYDLRHLKSKSCGCLKTDYFTIHGLSRTRVYGAWNKMKGRCEYNSNPSYKDYGGRGIKVCERWHSFENFFADMGHPPLELTLDRIDNNGDYEPDNCRWATRKVQQNNNRQNRKIKFNGMTKTIAEWAQVRGIKAPTIGHRIKRGWNPEKALMTPTGKYAGRKQNKKKGE